MTTEADLNNMVKQHRTRYTNPGDQQLVGEILDSNQWINIVTEGKD
jgi:hypothetical protein